MRCPLLFFTSLTAFAVLTATSTSASTLPSLPSRADKKPYGELCESSDECISGTCALGQPGNTDKICYVGQAGAPCNDYSQCASQECVDGKCTNKLLTPCADYIQCGTIFNNADILWCPAGECVKIFGGACTKDAECGPNRCYKGKCRRPPQRPNGDCDINAECVSGSKCIDNEVDPVCYDGDGVLRSCFSWYNHCTRFQTGHACRADGECLHGFCDKGKCSPGANGRRCKADYQCTEKNAICTTQGVCATPAPASLYPQEHCLLASTCRTGQCGHNNLTDAYDRMYYLQDYPDSPPQPFTCDYYDIGEGPCRNEFDCREGLCISGTCTRGADGQKCLYNQQCKNVCSKKGRCYTPTKRLADGEPCRTNAQCVKGKCYGGEVKRPLPTTGELYSFGDTICLDPDAPPSYGY